MNEIHKQNRFMNKIHKIVGHRVLCVQSEGRAMPVSANSHQIRFGICLHSVRIQFEFCSAFRLNSVSIRFEFGLDVAWIRSIERTLHSGCRNEFAWKPSERQTKAKRKLKLHSVNAKYIWRVRNEEIARMPLCKWNAFSCNALSLSLWRLVTQEC